MKKSQTSKPKRKKSSFVNRLATAKTSSKLFVVLFAVIAAYIVSQAFAATGQMYITPAITTIQQNETFTISVRINPETTVDGVDTTVSYDTSLLEFVSVDVSASPFSTELQSDIQPGSIQIVRGLLSSTINTDSLVANITFRALQPTSGSQVSLVGNATFAGEFTDPVSASTTITIIGPVVKPPDQDITSPIVSILEPANGAKPVRGKFTVQSSATDNSGTITKTEVYVDGSIVQTVLGPEATYAWSVKSRKIANGEHTITVKAYDGTGNVGSATITVVK